MCFRDIEETESAERAKTIGLWYSRDGGHPSWFQVL